MKIINKFISVYKSRGLKNLLYTVVQRIFQVKAKSFPLIEQIVSNGNGIEIGGPSTIFQKHNILPIYPKAHTLDNCNFNTNTIWNTNLVAGVSYVYNSTRPVGYQYIMDAANLDQIASETYSFLISSHVLEHIANPLKALQEWLRVLKTDGYLILVIPHKEGTFDHKRPTTSLEHLIKDFQENIGEDDLTHLTEILDLHDLSRDPHAGSYETFKRRSLDNVHNRSLHHHVFTTPLVKALMEYCDLDIKTIEPIKPMHIIAVAQKRKKDTKHSHPTTSPKILKSPFTSDSQ